MLLSNIIILNQLVMYFYVLFDVLFREVFMRL